MPHSELFAWLGNSVCKDEHPLQPVCSNILFLIAGVDAKINTVRISYCKYYQKYVFN